MTAPGYILSLFYLGKFRGFADKLAKGPRVQRVNGGREGDREDEDQEIAQRQIEDERVGDAAHRLVTTQDVDEGPVAKDTDQKDETEQDRNDVRFRSIPVLDVAALLVVIFVHRRRQIGFVHRPRYRFVHQHLVQHRQDLETVVVLNRF